MGISEIETSFICDDNLGKLAKLLRAYGYDVLFYRNISDGDLIAKALADNRHIITRDGKLQSKGAPKDKLTLIPMDNPDYQVKFVLEKLKLKPDKNKWLTRCIDCNATLIEISKEDYIDIIPPYVYQTLNEFSRCPKCGKLFWKGTHYQNIIKRLSTLIPNGN